MNGSSNEANPKIIDLIQKKEAGSKPFVSIEFFPPRTDTGVKVRTDFMTNGLDDMMMTTRNIGSLTVDGFCVCVCVCCGFFLSSSVRISSSLFVFVINIVVERLTNQFHSYVLILLFYSFGTKQQHRICMLGCNV